MVKNCPVIKNNAAITVFLFDGEPVQIPAIGRKANIINVQLKDGIFNVVADDYEEEAKTEEKPMTVKGKKKTTNEDKDFEKALELGEVE